MRQIAKNARERGRIRPQPVALRPHSPGFLAPGLRAPGFRASGAITRTARRPRPVEALVWLFRLLFVLPIGRQAREDRLGTLSDRVLRDIGILRADAHAAAWGMVPLQEVLPRYPADGRLVACARRGAALALVRLSEAA
ncbi:MAG: hypothetical protein ACREH3_08120 [Geminicoccales bacterium]